MSATCSFRLNAFAGSHIVYYDDPCLRVVNGQNSIDSLHGFDASHRFPKRFVLFIKRNHAQDDFPFRFGPRYVVKQGAI